MVVVGAEDLGALPALEAVENHGDEVHDGGVGQVGPASTGNVEVAQADPLQIPGALTVGHHHSPISLVSP